MAKRRRTSRSTSPATVHSTSTTQTAVEATSPVSSVDHGIETDIPPRKDVVNPSTGLAATNRVAADHKHKQEQSEDGDDEDEDVGNVDADGPSEKRKRKRTRTRKKKPPQGSDNGSDKKPPSGQGSVGVGAVGDDGSGSALTTGITDTIYVEGIPWACDEEDVREFFKGCGKITGVRMPRWQDSGRPRGYAHVSFSGAKAARAAFGLDGQYLKGRYLTVQAPQEPATEKARRANRTAEQPRGCRTVFVKNLPYDADEDGVAESLAGCGRINSVRLAMWNHTRKLKGFGYVEFATERGAETCVRTQDKLAVGGRPVVIDFETGAPKGSFRRQDGAQIKKSSADAGVGKGKAPKFKVHVK